jgi:excisionase family DNA binding protein
MNDRWLSVDEIGEYLGVKRDTVYNWINNKSMPAHKIGRLWKFKVSQVDAWVEAVSTQETEKNEN